MSTVSCPSCGHTFSPPAAATSAAPDPSVVEWFRTDQTWTRDASTTEVYASYLRATDGTPVPRTQFVADLAYLGIEEVLDDDTPLLLRR